MVTLNGKSKEGSLRGLTGYEMDRLDIKLGIQLDMKPVLPGFLSLEYRTKVRTNLGKVRTTLIFHSDFSYRFGWTFLHLGSISARALTYMCMKKCSDFYFAKLLYHILRPPSIFTNEFLFFIRPRTSDQMSLALVKGKFALKNRSFYPLPSSIFTLYRISPKF